MTAQTPTPAAIVTVNGRVHRKAECVRAVAHPVATHVSELHVLVDAVKPCTYCKPNEGTVEVAVELLTIAPTAEASDDEFPDECEGDGCADLIVGVDGLLQQDDEAGPIDDGRDEDGVISTAPEATDVPVLMTELTGIEHDDAEPAVIAEAVQPEGPSPVQLPDVRTVLAEHVAQVKGDTTSDQAGEARLAQVWADAVKLRTEGGLTISEIATQLEVPAKLLSARMVGMARGKKPAEKPAGKSKAATPAGKGKGEKKAAGPRTSALPPITPDDLSKLVARREAGASFRTLRDEFPHLQRAHSSLRAVVLAEQARRTSV